MSSSTNHWEGMDPDDVEGYLMDHIASWASKHGLIALSEESLTDRILHMEDDDKEEFILNCLQALGAKNA